MEQNSNGCLSFLCIGAGFSMDNNSAYYECEKTLTIIDMGYTVFNTLREERDLSQYEKFNVIITHLHPDHVGSLGQFIMFCKIILGKAVNVYSMCEHLKTYLEITGTTEDAYTLFNKSSEIEFIKTDHIPYLDTYGFKLKINNKKILYTGDTCILTPFIKYLDDVNEFYVDVSKNGGIHLKYEEVIPELIKIQNRGIQVYLMHIDDEEYIRERLPEGIKLAGE